MRVTKRNGELEEIAFDKILNRMKKIGQEVAINMNYQQLAMKVIEQLYDTISTTKIDELAAQQCASLSTSHPDYATLAGRIMVSNHQKNTEPDYFHVVNSLYNSYDDKNKHTPLVSFELWSFVKTHADEINAMLDYSRDYLIDYFGFKTLERAYLFKKGDQIVERPQHMWMRVAICIHGENLGVSNFNSNFSSSSNINSLKLIKETYDLMSQKYFTHATPTLFNAGTVRQQLSSCYLLGVEEDSIDGIFNTLKDCASISKYSGGIGLHINNVRAKDSHIKGTNGKTSGLVPMLRVFNNTARWVNQSGKRNGSFAIYLETWHADIFDFLYMSKNHGIEEQLGRDLFYALWISDLFMRRVKDPDGSWSLFCPNECPGLADVWGDEFEKLYEKYESEGKARQTIPARDLWVAILDRQMEIGQPYMVYKDASNRKSNQQNLGTIKSSNLCTEIIEYSDDQETAVCNLASIALPLFVNETTKEFDYAKLHQVTKVVANNLNKVIDINYYPTQKTLRSNQRHRPVGIGVQGLADTFVLMDIAFYSEQAKIVNKLIFETIYHASLEQSNEIAIERKRDILLRKQSDELKWLDLLNSWEYDAFVKNIPGVANYIDETHVGAYSTFSTSPASQGILQFDMWNMSLTMNNSRYDWDKLKASIRENGLRNSLLVSPMPTASTSQIFGFNECFEPFTSNMYSSRTLAGDFVVINKYLMRELIQMGYWNEEMKNNIIANKGSVQQLTVLPEHIRNKYKIVWEIPMKHVIDMAADRGPFICQSQSMSLWMAEPEYKKLTSMHFYAWEKGLKTGIYYLRRKARHHAQQFTIEPKFLNTETETEKKGLKEEGEEKEEKEEEEKEETHDICESCSA